MADGSIHRKSRHKSDFDERPHPRWKDTSREGLTNIALAAPRGKNEIVGGAGREGVTRGRGGRRGGVVSGAKETKCINHFEANRARWLGG